ncbi:MAG: methylmalonyl-CoA mutase family protein [Bacillota bacterium]
MGDEQGMINTKGKWHDWRAEAEKALKGKTFETLSSTTYEGITLKPLYTVEDYDFMQLSRSHDKRHENNWNISQVLSAEDCHGMSEKIKQGKNRGQQSFYVKNFSFLKKKEDLDAAFQHIDWIQDSFLFDVGEEIGVIPLLLHERKERNELMKLKGTLGFDPYESLLLNGKSTLSLQTNFDYLADTLKWCQENECNVRCLLIKGSLYHEDGANSLQELIYTFSHALDVINELLNRGLSIENIAKNMTFSFAIGSNFFMEIAKFRAAKQLWASLIHALGGNEASQKMYLHATTSTFNKTASDVQVNLLRTTTEGFSAAVAGVDELTIHPFDSVLPSGGELGERIARNTHFILKDESLISRVIDPAGGSYYVESLTNELAERAWNEIQEIDEKGGFLILLKERTLQKDLEKMVEKRLVDVNKKKTTIIGTNAFANLSDRVTATQQVVKKKKDHHNEANQVVTFQEALLFVSENKGLPIITTKFQQEQLQIEAIKPSRLVEHFEKLRIDAETYTQKTGQQPKVTVLVFGRLKDYKPRLDFVSSLLATGGMTVEVVSYDHFQLSSKVNTIIFCGKDEDYDLIDSSLISKIKAENELVHLFIAGNGHKKEIEEYGFKGFITANMNAYEFLVTMHNLMGVKGVRN